MLSNSFFSINYRNVSILPVPVIKVVRGGTFWHDYHGVIDVADWTIESWNTTVGGTEEA